LEAQSWAENEKQMWAKDRYSYGYEIIKEAPIDYINEKIKDTINELKYWLSFNKSNEYYMLKSDLEHYDREKKRKESFKEIESCKFTDEELMKFEDNDYPVGKDCYLCIYVNCQHNKKNYRERFSGKHKHDSEFDINMPVLTYNGWVLGNEWGIYSAYCEETKRWLSFESEVEMVFTIDLYILAETISD